MPALKKLKFRNKTPVASKRKDDESPAPQNRAKSASRAKPSDKAEEKKDKSPKVNSPVASGAGDITSPKSDIASANDNSTKKVQLKKKKDDQKTMLQKLMGGINLKLREQRDKTMYRDNYNYFVGDNEYKTDFFLRFHDKNIKY